MAIRQLSEKNNFLYLLLALTVFLFSGALTGDIPGGAGRDLFSLVGAMMLIIGVKSLHTGIALRRIVYFFAALLGSFTLIWHVYPGRWSALLILLILLFSFLGAFKLAVRKILFEGRVDANKIIGSLSLYLLLGLIWTIVYLILLTFDPGAFRGLETAEWREIFSQVAYYSFATLTTLGYGDIVPSSHVAGFFAYMEAVAGVFYMAIFVSSLINLSRTDAEKEEAPPRDGSPLR